MARRGLRLGLVLTVASCLAGLWAISYVGAARDHGVLAGDTGTQAIGPVSALAEMGGSLETASLAIEWAQNGDPFVLGGGYWLPFERALGAALPYLRNDRDADPRAMGNLLLSRVAGLGGSAVAESYYNFGGFGISFFLVLGYLLGRMEIRAGSPIAGAWLGVVLYVFVFQARNWFIGVPAMLFLGSLPVLACYALEWTARRRLLSLRAVAA
jgi:hypothetical protein